jgi:hypothetical protein
MVFVFMFLCHKIIAGVSNAFHVYLYLLHTTRFGKQRMVVNVRTGNSDSNRDSVGLSRILRH